MAIISDVGSPEYYELRAIEEIHAARLLRTDIAAFVVDETAGYGTYNQHINKAIQLLILARLNVCGSN